MDNGENKRQEQGPAAWWEGREMADSTHVRLFSTPNQFSDDVLWCLCRYMYGSHAGFATLPYWYVSITYVGISVGVWANLSF